MPQLKSAECVLVEWLPQWFVIIMHVASERTVHLLMIANKINGMKKIVLSLYPVLFLDIFLEVILSFYHLENRHISMFIIVLLVCFSAYRGAYIYNSKIKGYFIALLYYFLWRIFVAVFLMDFIFYNSDLLSEENLKYPFLYYVFGGVLLVFLTCLVILCVTFPFTWLGKRRKEKMIKYD
jgi:hypothetical protein